MTQNRYNSGNVSESYQSTWTAIQLNYPQRAEWMRESATTAAIALLGMVTADSRYPDAFAVEVGDEAQALLEMALMRFPELADFICENEFTLPRLETDPAVTVGRQMRNDDHEAALDWLDEKWHCGLCETLISNRICDIDQSHACCGCGWTDRASDKSGWVCPNCNPLDRKDWK